MSCLIWTRQRHSPVPTKHLFFLFIIMASVCHCGLIVGSKAIVQINGGFVWIGDVNRNLGLVQYSIELRQLQIGFHARFRSR